MSFSDIYVGGDRGVGDRSTRELPSTWTQKKVSTRSQILQRDYKTSSLAMRMWGVPVFELCHLIIFETDFNEYDELNIAPNDTTDQYVAFVMNYSGRPINTHRHKRV